MVSATQWISRRAFAKVVGLSAVGIGLAMSPSVALAAETTNFQGFENALKMSNPALRADAELVFSDNSAKLYIKNKNGGNGRFVEVNGIGAAALNLALGYLSAENLAIAISDIYLVDEETARNDVYRLFYYLYKEGFLVLVSDKYVDKERRGACGIRILADKNNKRMEILSTSESKTKVEF
jgi:hypothetical protein